MKEILDEIHTLHEDIQIFEKCLEYTYDDIDRNSILIRIDIMKRDLHDKITELLSIESHI